MPPEYTGGSRTTREGGAQSRKEQLQRELDTVEFELWLVVLVTLVLDVFLTYKGLRHGLAEGNPILGPAMEQFGFVALVAAKVFALAIAGCCRRLRPEYGAIIPLGIAVPWLVAVVVNSLHLAPLL